MSGKSWALSAYFKLYQSQLMNELKFQWLVLGMYNDHDGIAIWGAEKSDVSALYLTTFVEFGIAILNCGLFWILL